MQILNNKVTLKYSFTLAGKPMEVYTAEISLDQSNRQGEGALGITANNPTSVVIRKGDEVLYNQSIFMGNFWHTEELISNWITDQEMANAARNGDTD